MGHPALAAGLSHRTRPVLSYLMTTGQSEDHGIAEMLNTIAENGDDMASDAMLRTSAQNIIHDPAWPAGTIPPAFFRTFHRLYRQKLFRLIPGVSDPRHIGPACLDFQIIIHAVAPPHTRRQRQQARYQNHDI